MGQGEIMTIAKEGTQEGAFMPEYRVLQRYIRGGEVRTEDYALVEKLAAVGLVKKGINTYKGTITVRTTDLGRRLIKA